MGINTTTVSYGVSANTTTHPEVWEKTLESVKVEEGQYLWTRTIIDYTDEAKEDTVSYTYARQGETGQAGTSVTVKSIEYQAGTSATTAPTGTWSSTVVPVNEGQYLWTKTTFSDGKEAYGVAKQGEKGETGASVTIVETRYGVSTNINEMPAADEWKESIAETKIKAGEYLWTRTEFSDGEFSYSIAKQGENGETPILYKLLPSHNVIKISNNAYTPSQLDIVVNKQDGNTISIYEFGAETDIVCKYSIDSETNFEILEESTLVVSGATNYVKLRVVSKNGNTVYDSETIPVIKDGEQGEKGESMLLYPAGEWDSKTTYKIDGNAVPYVLHRVGDKDVYWYLGISSSEGVEPGIESGTTHWVEMETFNSIYTDLIVANCGTIGGAVYYEHINSKGEKYNFLFSTEGKKRIDDSSDNEDDNLEDSSEYKYFMTNWDDDSSMSISDPSKILYDIYYWSKFIPNVLICFTTGDSWFGCGSTIFKKDGSGTLANGSIEWHKDEKNNTTLGIKGNIKTYDVDNKETSIMGDIDVDDFDIAYEQVGDTKKVSKAILVAGIEDYSEIAKFCYQRIYPLNMSTEQEKVYPSYLFTGVDYRYQCDNEVVISDYSNHYVGDFYFAENNEFVEYNKSFYVIGDGNIVSDIDGTNYLDSNGNFIPTGGGLEKVYTSGKVFLLYEIPYELKVVYSLVREENAVLYNEELSTISKKNATTIITDDGIIITDSLIANGGNFGGDINSGGIFNGKLNGVNGTLNECYIENKLSNGKNIIIETNEISDTVNAGAFPLKYNMYTKQNKDAKSVDVYSSQTLMKREGLGFSRKYTASMGTDGATVTIQEGNDIIMEFNEKFCFKGHHYWNKNYSKLSSSEKTQYPLVSLNMEVTYKINNGEEQTRDLNIGTVTVGNGVTKYSGGCTVYFKITPTGTKVNILEILINDLKENNLLPNGLSNTLYITDIKLGFFFYDTIYGRQGADYESYKVYMENGEYSLYEVDKGGNKINDKTPKMHAGTNQIVLSGGGISLIVNENGIIVTNGATTYNLSDLLT